MVLIGLGCCLAMAAGIKVGLMTRRPPDPMNQRPQYAFPFAPLMIAYVASIFIEGTLITISPSYPSFRQIIVTLDTARLGVLFLILRRLCAGDNPKWGLLAVIVFVGVTLGIPGFFAGFREPVVLAVLAVLEIFDPKNPRHWAAITVSILAISFLGIVWMGIRSDYRREYVEVDQFAGSRNARI